MAGVALRGRRYVCWPLDLCIDRHVRPAVTSRAVPGGDGTRRTRVAHDGGLERRVVLVAGITLRSGRNVCSSLKHFGGATGNVTTRACTCSSGRVRKCGSRPNRRRVVARIALCGGRYMCGRFRLSIHSRVCAAMARRTVSRRNRSCGAGVAHNRWLERRIVFVTRVALRRRGNMGGRLEHSRRATSDVASRTITRCRGGVGECCATPDCGRPVTAVTLRCRRQVRRGLGLRVH
jgi:hypothetical protein